MLINTKFLGEVVISEQDIIDFKFGLPGFPNETKFALLPIDEKLPLALLQSTNQSEIGFVVAYPFVFKSDYAFDLSEEDLKDLKVENAEDIVTYSIVTLRDSLPESTMNLLAPVIINLKKKCGKQIVLIDNEKYSLRHPMGMLEGSAK